MRPKTNRLLMLLIGASLAGCASQTERSSSGGGAESTVEFERVGGTSNVVTREELERRAAAEAAAAAAAPEPPPAQSAAETAPSEPEYEPQREDVQYIDTPLEEAPVTAAAPPPPAETASAEEEAPVEAPPPPPASTASADEPLPDFPITKYEIEEPTEQADAQSEEIEDLGTQPDESTTAGSSEESVTTGESSVGEPTEYPDEPEEIAAAEEPSEVEDLGTQPDESGAQNYAEEEREPSGRGIGDPTVYPDEPVQQAAAPTTPSVSVNFEAEPLFSFDKAVIRKDQRTALDEFVASLQDIEYDEISAVGHADQIGSEGYNDGLSERRANAVKDYLVAKGIAADKIRVEARGESEPVTADTCANKRGKALISCLQPDRRVDVTVTGSQSD